MGPWWIPTLVVVALAVEDTQDRQEQVQDIQVQTDGCRNFLLHMVMAHDQLGVDEDVAAEDESRDDAVPQLDHLAVWKESGQEAKDDQHPQRAKEVGHPRREVVLALAGEECQGHEDAQGQDERFQHDPAFVEGCDDANAVCFQRRKSAQEDQVDRIRLALPEREKHEDDGPDEGDPHHPRVRLNPSSVSVREERDRGERRGQEELHREDAVHLADELHADVGGRFGYRTAKLVNLV